MSCTQNGTLLQPSRPMSALDICYAGDAFKYNAGQPRPVKQHVYPIMSSHTRIPVINQANIEIERKLSRASNEHIEHRLWTDVLAIGLARDAFDLTAAHIPLDLDIIASHFVAWTG